MITCPRSFSPSLNSRLGTFSFTLMRDVTFLYRYLKCYPLIVQPRRDFEGTICKNWPLCAANQVAANHKGVDSRASFAAITWRYFVHVIHSLLAVKLSSLLCITKIGLIFYCLNRSELQDGDCRRISPSWMQHQPFSESMVFNVPAGQPQHASCTVIALQSCLTKCLSCECLLS